MVKIKLRVIILLLIILSLFGITGFSAMTVQPNTTIPVDIGGQKAAFVTYDWTNINTGITSGSDALVLDATQTYQTVFLKTPTEEGTYELFINIVTYNEHGSTTNSGSTSKGIYNVVQNVKSINVTEDITTPAIGEIKLIEVKNGIAHFNATVADNVGVTGYQITAEPFHYGIDTFTLKPDANGICIITINEADLKNGNYYLWVRDKAGNVAVKLIYKETATPLPTTDTTPPIISEIKFIEIKNGIAYFDVIANDNVGITGYLITAEPKYYNLDLFTLKPNADGTFRFQLLEQEIKSGNTYYVWARDEAGNVTCYSIDSKILQTSSTLPAISVQAQETIIIDINYASMATLVCHWKNTNTGITWQEDKDYQQNSGPYRVEILAPAEAATYELTLEIWDYVNGIKQPIGTISKGTYTVTTKAEPPDTQKPNIKGINYTTQANATQVEITVVAADNVGVVGYAIATTTKLQNEIKKLAQPSPNFVVKENNTYYAWAIDAAGNISNYMSVTITNIVKPDTTAPQIIKVERSTEAQNVKEVILTITAQDNVGIAGYALTTTPTRPSANNITQKERIFTVKENKSYYAWVKDAAENVSTEEVKIEITNIGVQDTTAPTITKVVVEKSGNSASLKIESSDNVGVTAFKVTTTATKPKAEEITEQIPTLKITENKTYYVWARDVAGNVSEGYQIYIEVPTTDILDIFGDLDKDHWAYDIIKQLVNDGIINGYEDGTFRPEDKVSRAEFAKMLVCALDLELIKPSQAYFADLPSDNWAYSYVETARKYLTGYTVQNKYYFIPNNSAVREDMAVALVKALGLEKAEVSEDEIDTVFKDADTISPNLKKYVLIAYKEGLIKGYEDKTFKAQNTITRAETATLIVNALIIRNMQKVTF